MGIKTITRQFKCDNCEDGIVIYKATETRTQIKLTTKDCNSCKKGFGLFSISKLQEIKNGGGE